MTTRTAAARRAGRAGAGGLLSNPMTLWRQEGEEILPARDRRGEGELEAFADLVKVGKSREADQHIRVRHLHEEEVD